MKLVVAKLKEGENCFAFTSQGGGWLQTVVEHLEKTGHKLEGQMAVEISVTKLEPDYYLRGSLDAKVWQTCARCAEGFVLPVHQNYEFGLVHVSAPESKEQSKLVRQEEKDELDLTYFEGGEIDLGPIIEEQFYLSLPFQALCREGCKGVCQQCGQNLNESTCNCKTPAGNSPFSVLKDYKV